jgi:hypothetical protein
MSVLAPFGGGMIDSYLGRTMTFSEYLASSFDQELIAAIRRHRLVLLLGPPIAALLFYAINPDLPGMYVSKAYVRLDRASAESLAEERTYSVIVDRFLGELPVMKEKSTISRLYHLKTFMELVDVEPPESTANRRLYRLEMTHRDPVVAQSINRQMLERWLVIYPAFDWSNIIIAPPDLPTRTARPDTMLAALSAGIATLGVLLFLAAWKPLFRGFREWRYGLRF